MPDARLEDVGPDDPFVAFVREQRCCVDGRWPVDPQHYPTRGARGRNYHRRVAPLCRECHDECDDAGVETFQRRHGIRFDDVIDALELRFVEEGGTLAL